MTLGRWLLLVGLLAVGWWQLRSDAVPVRHGPGVLVSEPPLQTVVEDAASLHHKGYSLQPLARFELRARVLSREDYRFDRGAELVPVDLALGWGPMSDDGVLEHIDISQGGRWYRWSVPEFPIPRRDIERHSANMHLIPADDGVEDSIRATRPGDLVRFSGRLVEARGPDGWRWRSSLSRDDTGANACELVLVERFSVLAGPGR